MGIYHVTGESLSRLQPLFHGQTDTLLLSCLQGHMGSAWADSESNPASAQIVVADFCFFGGEPMAALAGNKPPERASDFVIMIPKGEAWAALIEQVYGENAKKVTRYALRKEPTHFDRDRLTAAVCGLDAAYEVVLIDEKLFDVALSAAWSRDLCAAFENYQQYSERGVGAAVLYQGALVAGASSYTFYNGGIEVEIDTREDFRRKGLAYACGARLLLACIDRGLYPSWDAQNPWSLALAEKLGYRFDKAYDAYEVTAFGKGDC